MQFLIKNQTQQLLLTPQQTLPAPELLLPFFCSWLKAIPDLTQVQAEQGLDWLHIRFYFQNAAFALHYEHYSDSCWVDTDNTTAAVLLSDLASLLQSSAT